jgi:uncharacterized repeat protein (TIGR03803 family)
MKKRNRLDVIRTVQLLGLGLSVILPPAAYAATEKTLYVFKGAPDAGFPDAGPMGTLISDSSGNLYGVAGQGGTGTCINFLKTNTGCGAVFKVSPPASSNGTWTETLLYSFQNMSDGSGPEATLTADAAGNLYGTADVGPNGSEQGEVFELSPPASGGSSWTLTVLYSFGTGTDAQSPGVGALVPDGNGNLYGTTIGGGANSLGAVYRLSPPQAGETAWTETVLHSFGASSDGQTPIAGMIFDGSGNLFGTTELGGTGPTVAGTGCGTVFELSPPSAGEAAWTETILHNFEGADGCTPESDLVFDAKGALYGSTEAGGANFSAANENAGDGAVFKLSPPQNGATAWTESVLHSFKETDGEAPLAGVVFDAKGNLYSSTFYGGKSDAVGGVVFELSPPASSSGSWSFTLLHSFAGNADGTNPVGTLLRNANTGALLGIAQDNTDQCCGNVFQITP